MKRGQAEQLMPLCQEVLKEANLTWQDISLIGVGVGPGNFTGIRIAVSAARGVALGLGIPAIGVTGFEQLHQGYHVSGQAIVSLPASREQAYVQTFSATKPIDAPRQIDPTDATQSLTDLINPFVLGYKAAEIGQQIGAPFDEDFYLATDPEMIASNIALIANNKFLSKDFQAKRPVPLYVRAADAAPPRDAAPVLLP